MRDLNPPTVFGELAILYNCKRTATVTAKTPTKVWKLERNVFQSIMRTTAKTRREELKKVSYILHHTETEIYFLLLIKQASNCKNKMFNGSIAANTNLATGSYEGTVVFMSSSSQSILCITKCINQFCYSSIEVIAVYNEKLKINSG